MNWNHDISAAPRGKMVHSTRTVGDRVHEISDFVPDHIWAASKCGKVIKSYWIPPVGKADGRWSGFANGEQPIAWQHYVVPDHPYNMRDGANETMGGLPVPAASVTAERTGRNSVYTKTDRHGTPHGSGVTGGESAATSFQVSNRANGESGANASKGVTAGETATLYLEDVGSGA